MKPNYIVKFIPCVLPALLTGLACEAASFTSDFNGFGTPAGSSVAGTAAVDTSGGLGNSGVLKLTSTAGGQQGGFYVDDFLNGDPVNNFRVSFKVAIGGGTVRPADGMAFSFGSDVAGGGFGEEGSGTGITVTMDTWDNNGTDTAPAIEVLGGNVLAASQSMSTGGETNPFREGGRAPAGEVLLDGAGNPVSLQTYGSAPASASDAAYVDVLIELFADQTLSMTWSNVVVFDHVAVNYSPISGGRFAFGARTGGATETHWIENLQIYANFTPGPVQIVEQPTNQSVTETKTVTFSLKLEGTPDFAIQWFKDGSPLPGANQPTYTTPPATLDMNGSVYYAEIKNSETATAVKSDNATLSVSPGTLALSASTAGRNNQLAVRFSKPVKLDGTYSVDNGVTLAAAAYGATHAEVVLPATGLNTDADYTVTISGVTGEDNSVLLPNPTVLSFHHGFGAFCQNFDDLTVPAPSAVGGVAKVADIEGNGIISLTDNGVTGACGQFFIPNLSGESPLANLHARWKSRVFSSGSAADGYSFNWGTDVAAGCAGSEEGNGSGLSVTVDTFDNGCGDCSDGTDVGLEIKWRGNQVAFEKTTKSFLAKGEFVDAEVVVTPEGQATFTYDDIVLKATLPGFGAGVLKGNYAFVARTGGASEDAWIDDVCINSAALGPIAITTQPVDTSIEVGASAQFKVAADGTYPHRYQWLLNGVPVPGATAGTFTTAITTLAQDGAVVSVVVSNDFSTATSQNAVLRVTSTPRTYGAFCEDFSDNALPEGTTIRGAATVGGGTGTDGIIHLTDAGQAGVTGVFWIPNQSGTENLDRLQARWRTLVGGGENSGADGYSFNWGPGVRNDIGNTEGNGTGLSVTVDTFDNGCGDCADGTDTGIEMKWKGARVAYMHTSKAAIRANEFVDVEALVSPEGEAVFNFDGMVIRANLPGFQGLRDASFSFAASTGGANDNHWIDDVRINCFDLTAPAITLEPTDAPLVTGQPITFTADFSGLIPAKVQWFRNNVAIPGATYRVYTTPALDDSEAGAKYKMVVTNPLGVATSREVVVTGADRPVISIQANSNGTVTLSWTGPGVLEAATSLDGPWATVEGAASPFTFTPTEARQFGRIRVP
ncbi:MAG: hypothetical protein JNN07_02150 [Verrucomicrobiales bacterium]|nr:hypothetical protein [Verrucomicrobiales bacterium]